MKNLSSYFNPSRFSTIPYQIFFMIAASLIFFVMLRTSIREFHPAAHEPGIKVMAPGESVQGKMPVIVNTGFVLSDFLKFDALKNEFLINAIVWFEFDPTKVDLATLEKFSFTKGEIIHKSEPFITKKSDHLTQVRYHIRLQFSTIFDYSRFPLDDHRIFLNLINSSASPEQFVYEVKPDNFVIDKNLYISGWHIVGSAVRSGYAQVKIGEGQEELYPKVVFSLDLSKDDMRQVLIILMPLLLIFFFSVFALSISDIVLSITVIAATVSALIAYSFVMQTISPAVGYFMMSDYFFLSILCCIFLIFLAALLESPEYSEKKRIADIIRGVTIPIIYALLIIAWYYLIYVKNIA